MGRLGEKKKRTSHFARRSYQINSIMGGNALLLRSCYKESNAHYNVLGVNNILFRGKSPPRNDIKQTPEKKRSAKRSPESACLVKRLRYEKAKSTLQNQRGHGKSTTDKVIQMLLLTPTLDIISCLVTIRH